MAAYASPQREFLERSCSSPPSQLRLAARLRNQPTTGPLASDSQVTADMGAALLAQLVDQLTDRVVAAVAERLALGDARDDEWYDSRHAADYLGVHRDTLRKLAAERAIRAEQEGPGCKLYFRRSDLDAWRRAGGRPRHLASVA